MNERRYILYRKDGEIHWKWNPEYKGEPYVWHRVTDPKEEVHDGDMLRVGKRKFVLITSSDAPIEEKENGCEIRG